MDSLLRMDSILASPAFKDRHQERILIVDDSATVRRMYSACLAAQFEIAEAGSFDEAVSKLKEDEYAVVITDIIMPGQSGIELLRRIIQNFPGTEVIVATGVERPQRALDAMRVGAFDYLIKPFDAEVLQITVDRALAHRSLLLTATRYKRELESRNTELARQKEHLGRLQATIVQSEKMASLGQLAAGVAHELNNPVGFVHANLEILNEYISKLIKFHKESRPGEMAGLSANSNGESIDYPALLEDLDSILTDCREGTDRIRDITQNLRTFSRLDEAEFKHTNVHEGIDATVRLLSTYFSSGNIKIQRDFGDLPLYSGFSSQLNQVWMNLLVNAAQAIGPQDGKVSIRTWDDETSVFVEISDTGAGIAVQHLKRIFDPFFTTKPVGEGTGLGLSISFGIVERHRGSISVDTLLGRGTTFTVRLPKDFEPDFVSGEKSIVLASEITKSNYLYEVQNIGC